jgi:hypothetical protein
MFILAENSELNLHVRYRDFVYWYARVLWCVCESSVHTRNLGRIVDVLSWDDRYW